MPIVSSGVAIGEQLGKADSGGIVLVRAERLSALVAHRLVQGNGGKLLAPRLQRDYKALDCNLPGGM